jgi:hypothetical protein
MCAKPRGKGKHMTTIHDFAEIIAALESFSEYEQIVVSNSIPDDFYIALACPHTKRTIHEDF